MRIPIPDDWNGTDYCYSLICWPDSIKWQAILLGQVTALARGWFWDEKTGSILTIQAVANQLLLDNTDSEGVIMGCGDLVAVLETMTAAIQNIEAAQIDIEISAAASAASSATLNSTIVAVSQSLAISQSWAQSIASSNLSVEITNNVAITIGPTSPTMPPVLEQEEETGVTTVAAPSNEYCDVATYIVDYAIAWFEALQDLSLGIGTFTVTGLYGMIGEVFTALTLRGVPIPITPATIIAILVGELYAWVLTSTFETNRDNGRQILADNREALICTIFNAAENGDDTSVIRAALESDLDGFGASGGVISACMAIISLPVTALIYYVSPLVEIPTGESDCEPCGV